MSRTAINSTSKQVASDGGGVLWSFIQGEQLEYGVTLSFLTELTGYTFEAVVVESVNGLPGAHSTSLNVTYPGTGNRITIQFPETLGSDWVNQPTPDSPTTAFFELRVTEPAGSFPKTWKPLRGMVELLFSPTNLV